MILTNYNYSFLIEVSYACLFHSGFFLTEELYCNRIVSPSATQQTIHFTIFTFS